MGSEVKKIAKEYILKNNYTLGFSIIILLNIIFLIFSYATINTGVGIIDQLTNLLPTTIWTYFLISFIVSYILSYYEKYKWITVPIFVVLLFFVLQTRTANVPELIDVTTGNYTLGPDLDPFLYLRNAREIVAGTISETDNMRYIPFGAPSYLNYNIIPYAIVWVYKILSIFSATSIEYSAIILPVILFLISLIGFFLFTKEIFSFKMNRTKSSIIALIASFFYAFTPSMLHRTTGGIPELESLGMAFFWFAFLFFTLAWKNKEKSKWVIYGIIGGIFTGLMSWSWGGYKYIYMILSLATLVMFLIEKDTKKNIIIFTSWLVPSLIAELIRGISIRGLISNIPVSGFALGVLLLLVSKEIINKLKIKRIEKINLPKSIVTIIVVGILGIVLLSIINPKGIVNLISNIIEGLLFPFGKGRVGLTVAENKAPYLVDAIQQFSYLIWVFFIAVLVVFYEAVKHFSKKNRIALMGSFAVFFICIIFSRVSSTSILNGENFISSFVFLAGIAIFAFFLLKIFIKAYREKREQTLNEFKDLDFSYLLLISFSFWAIISIRGAIRLFFIISPMMILIASYLPVKILEYKKKTKDELIKALLIILTILVAIALIITFIQYANSSISEAKATVPGIYEQQWQKAMQWVRENTPSDAVFSHWWDYGYWVQTIGERATVTDGGHYIGYWDHLTGRYILTATLPEIAESFMKTHNSNYLLIDSTDLGKYSAYSSIGSDSNYDRFSSISLMRVDNSQTRETNSTTTKFHLGTGVVDEDLTYTSESENIIIPGPTYDEYGTPNYKGYIIAIALEQDTKTGGILQPKGIFLYNQNQVILPIRYLYYNNKLIDYGSGVESVYMIIPQLYSSTGGYELDKMGSGIYLSPKVAKSTFAQLYLLGNSEGLYGDFELQHVEEDIITTTLRQQGATDLGYFVDYNGFRGPIKIWKLKDNPKIAINEEFLETSGGYAEYDNLTFVK